MGARNNLRRAVVLSAAALWFVPSCSSDEGEASNGRPGSGGNGAADASGGSGGSGGFLDSGPNGPFADFPATPIIGSGLPMNIKDLFDAPPQATASAPCLSEPSIEALVPKNWSPLLFEWSGAPELNVYELRLSVDNQVNDLLIYTSDLSFTIDKAMWTSLTTHSAGRDIMVRLRAGHLENGALSMGPSTGAEGPVHLAPVAAPGSVVYWTSSPSAALKGFTVGDTSVSTILTPAIVGGDTTCVACHVSAPDGNLTFYTRDGANSVPRAIDARSVDGLGSAAPDGDVSPVAKSLLGRDKQTAPVLSKAHYGAVDSVVVSVYYSPADTASRYELAWTDLHATDPGTGWGILPRNGDPHQAASPTWWHDGSTIAYVSAENVGEGVVASPGADGAMDIYTVPYNDRQGGTATPLNGASDPNTWEFYPVISPEDKLLAFNRCAPVAGADSYDEPNAEVFVLPATGGTALRLEGNDPPACTGKVSPGLTNSWPRWAPEAVESSGKKYYWVVFSSKRRDNGRPQLYVSGVVTTLSGGTESIERAYPALYVSAQPGDESNHTPAWDVFKVPQPP